tara:strand:+ start:504 stop:1982 length:1479 start_codon:yes stop_codon:yes gene_type:complete
MSKISLKNNYCFYFLLIIALILSSIISYENIGFDLYFNYKYKDYSDYFRGLLTGERVLAYNDLSTFPMWGYGLVRLLLKSKFNILIFQQLLNFITFIEVDRFLIKVEKIKNINFSRCLMLISLPLFFFHTQMWPKSISSSILILSILQLFYYLKNKKISKLVYTGILLGLLSNLRSDYLFFIFILPFFLLFYEFYQNRGLKLNSFKVFIMPVIVLIFLVPWSNYTFSKTNHYLLNSTNTGHVLFIGLGQLPNNIWGITPIDNDSKMMGFLINEFEQDTTSRRSKFSSFSYSSNEFEQDTISRWGKFSSFSYSSNEFLKKKFTSLVLDNPWEWIKKCIYSLRLLILDPFYVGNVADFQHNDVSNIGEIRTLEKAVYQFDFHQSYKILIETNWLFSTKEIFEILITILTKLIGLAIFITSVVTISLTILKYPKSIFNDSTLLLSYLLLAYQLSISVFAFHMPVYNSSIYLIYLIILTLFFNKLFSIKQKIAINK